MKEPNLPWLSFMPPAESQDEAAIANPALQNYLDQGGSLSIEERGDLGQIGGCYFENNRQWEEWALLRGDCPVGGVEVTGYATPAVNFPLTLTEPLPAPEVPQDTTGHAWLVGLTDGTVCEFATGATGGVGDERINYLYPSPDLGQEVVILGNLQPGTVWMAQWTVLTGSVPDPTVLESAMVPVRTVWRWHDAGHRRQAQAENERSTS